MFGRHIARSLVGPIDVCGCGGAVELLSFRAKHYHHSTVHTAVLPERGSTRNTKKENKYRKMEKHRELRGSRESRDSPEK